MRDKAQWWITHESTFVVEQNNCKNWPTKSSGNWNNSSLGSESRAQQTASVSH